MGSIIISDMRYRYEYMTTMMMVLVHIITI